MALLITALNYSIQQINVTECQVNVDITLDGNVTQNTSFDFQYQLASSGATLFFGTVTVLAGNNTANAFVGSASTALCSDSVVNPCINTVTGDDVFLGGYACIPQTSTTTTTTTSTTTAAPTTTTTTTSTTTAAPTTTTTTTTSTTTLPVGAIVPSVSNLPKPVLGINMPNMTYEQFLQSLGKYNYGAEFFYVSASNYQQISQPVNYNRFLADGNSINTFLPFSVDPYQSQPSIFYESDSEQVIITALSSMSFTMLANGTVDFKFFSTITYIGSELDAKGDSNFDKVEKAEGINFFEDYCNYLIDNE